ncbi:TldD/PmbA family protein [Bdellovibrio sp. HCB209]|uniref:TldD/PmbA family protein n=1 Tax=Bdellovibrio sp. HCB209 TaxID=3394354 RepID=UPI0039B423B7
MNFIENTKNIFNALADHLFAQLTDGEQANLNLSAEESVFIRFNNNKVRQNTHIEQRTLTLQLQNNQRTAKLSFDITSDVTEDKQRVDEFLILARKECELLPVDPKQVEMRNNGTSNNYIKGHLLTHEEMFAKITGPAEGSDLAGIYCAGPRVSASRNSAGQNHFFATDSFFIDYSLYHGEKAVKGTYAGTTWNQDEYAANLALTKNQLKLMDRPKKVLKPGAYKVYLAPGAVAELASMFSWGAMSYSAYKQGNSALQKLADKEKSLSKLLSIRENFATGLTPPFNYLGEVSAEKVELINNGELKTFLISSGSAKEYSVEGNLASPHEGPRAMEILPGSLKKDDILKELGTGVYLSNLHYLNWSDRPTARITGMTRYACFWVENGEIVAPIADMRFDESLYEALGENLLAVTNFQEVDPSVDTYSSRSWGGKKLPGFLIKDFKFTL